MSAFVVCWVATGHHSIQCCAQESRQPAPLKQEYREYAESRAGNANRGRQVFLSQEAACTQCHTVDGSTSKAGPDLYGTGNKFSRNDLIDTILNPSAQIAVGYETTLLETKSGEIYSGIIKEVREEAVMLMTADGRGIQFPDSQIIKRRVSNVSLMPEGLHTAMSLQEFSDLIAYLSSLKQAENPLNRQHGMPEKIAVLKHPVVLRPFLREEHRLPNAYVEEPGDVRHGLVYFTQVPGLQSAFAAVHQTGKIWLFQKNGNKEQKSLFADFGSEVFYTRGPNGLLGLAFHPDYCKNRKYYLKHQVLEGDRIATVLVEKHATPDLRRDSGRSSRRLLRIECTTQNHTGGCIQFGPDGYLYLGMGDTGPQRDPQGHGQDLTTLLGKMLRINVDHKDPGLPYAIPEDNPFVGRKEVCPEIWAYGFREPWRFSIDCVTGELWVGDVGQDKVEEVTIVQKGENHGWNVFEGFEPFSIEYRENNQDYTRPVFAYRREYGNSVTGGYVYRGDKESSFYGVYICGDYTSRRIWGITHEDRTLKKVREIAVAPEPIASFAADEQGNVYVVGYEGMVYKLDFNHAHFDDIAGKE